MNAAKRITSMTLAAVLALSLAACGDSTDDAAETTEVTADSTAEPSESTAEEYELVLSDDEITLDGQAIAEEDTGASDGRYGYKLYHAIATGDGLLL